MVMKPGEHKRSKSFGCPSYVERYNLLFCTHTLYINNVTKTLLLASSSVRSRQVLCLVHGQGSKSEQKPTTKKFVGFHNQFPLTMINCIVF